MNQAIEEIVKALAAAAVRGLAAEQNSGIEQWSARRAHNPEVAGSNPAPASSHGPGQGSPTSSHNPFLSGITFTGD